jgi:pyruvate/2-oxoacid:ferredoxin oxidoreductase alpha subunit
MDYTPVTHGGGQGNYRNIVLAPASAQECYDLTQLAFHLADKYRNPVVVLLDTVVAETVGLVEMKGLNFGTLPDKDWAMVGKGHRKDGQRRFITSGQGFIPSKAFPSYMALLQGLTKKVADMGEEVRCESLGTEDADVILVSFGYSSQVSHDAMNMARSEGLKVGLIKMISLWPFPGQEIKKRAGKGVKFLVVEDNLGGMDADVRLAVEGKSSVDVINALDGHFPEAGSAISPEKVLQGIKKLM